MVACLLNDGPTLFVKKDILEVKDISGRYVVNMDNIGNTTVNSPVVLDNGNATACRNYTIFLVPSK